VSRRARLADHHRCRGSVTATGAGPGADTTRCACRLGGAMRPRRTVEGEAVAIVTMSSWSAFRSKPVNHRLSSASPLSLISGVSPPART
jgi:hypothetical protein